MRRPVMTFCLALLVGLTPTAFAIDHDNLDEGRPLRLEDAYPIVSGEWALETGAGLSAPRKSRARGLFPMEVLYGLAPNLQVSLGTTIITDPRRVDEQTKSGDLQLSGLYNFNQETLSLPALGLRLTLNLPTGTESSGVDFRIKGLITKSIGRLSIHFNPTYEMFSGTKPFERDGRYDLALGASYPVGAPKHTLTTILGDVFTEQAPKRGDPQIAGAEIGIRHQWTPWTVLDAGVGTEFAGPTTRASIFLILGFSIGF
jgi:outer membrane putative beta-barrel porin/alpha-amylase